MKASASSRCGSSCPRGGDGHRMVQGVITPPSRMLALALSLDGLRDIVVLGSAEDPSIGGFESVMMGPPKERIVLRWPEDGLSEDVGDPMRGEFRFQWPTHGFLVEHQHLVDGAWSTRRTHRRTSIAACIDGWRTPAGRGWAHRWVGALSYDLSAWSMPIPRRQVPSPGSVIGLLWRSERWARLNQEGASRSKGIERGWSWFEMLRQSIDRFRNDGCPLRISAPMIAEHMPRRCDVSSTASDPATSTR